MVSRWQRVRAYLVARFTEASTWRGLILVATGLGLKLAPEMQEAIVALGLVAAGAVGAAAPDKGGK